MFLEMSFSEMLLNSKISARWYFRKAVRYLTNYELTSRDPGPTVSHSRRKRLQQYCTSVQLIPNPCPSRQFLHFRYCSDPCINCLMRGPRCVMLVTHKNDSK